MPRLIFSLFPNVFSYRASQTRPGQIRQAIVAAIEQAIQEQGEEVSATSVLGGLITALATQAAEIRPDPDTPASITFLINSILLHVTPNVLRAKFDTCTDVLLGAAEVFSENSSCLKHILAALGKIIGAQDPDAFSSSGLQRVLKPVLEATVDTSPKVRKAALEGIHDAFFPFSVGGATVPQSLVQMIAEFSKKKLVLLGSASQQQKAHEVARICVFLREVISFIPSDSARPLCVQLLAVATSKASAASAAAMEALSQFCAGASGETSVSLFVQLLKALLEIDADFFSDNYVSAAYVELLGETFLACFRSNQEEAFKRISPVVSVITRFYENSSISATFQRRPVSAPFDHKAKTCLGQCVQDTFCRLIESCGSSLVEYNHQGSQGDLFSRVISHIQGCLRPEYGPALKYTLPVVASLANSVGRGNGHSIETILESVAAIHTLCSQDASTLHAYNDAVSSTITGIGPERVLSTFGFAATDSEGEIDTDDLIKRAWILPLMQKGVKTASLEFYGSTFLPLASRLRETIASRVESGLNVEAKNLSIVLHQVFAMFPSFCTFPVDVAAGLPSLGPKIAPILQGNADAEVHDSLCHGIARLVANQKAALEGNLPEGVQLRDIFHGKDRPTKRDNEENDSDSRDHAALREIAQRNIDVMKNLGKNFLPIFLSLSTKKDAPCKRARDAIEEYLKIMPSVVVKEYFSLLMKKLLTKTGENAQLAHLHADLALAFVPAIDIDSVKILFRVIKILIADASDGAAQKRAYKMITKIAERQDGQVFLDEVVGELQNILLESSSSCAAAGRRHRLHCVGQLVATTVQVGGDPETLVRTFAPEIMLSLKEANTKARNAAVNVLIQFSDAFESRFGEVDGVNALIRVLVAGLAGATSRMVSATLEALGRVLHRKRKSRIIFATPELVESGLILLRHRAREVAKAAVLFIKIIVAILKPQVLKPYVGPIVRALFCEEATEARNVMKNRIRNTLAKLMKKSSFEEIAEHMSEENAPLLQYVRKMIHRDDRKREKNRSDAGPASDAASSDEDDSYERLFNEDADDNIAIEGEEVDFFMPLATKTNKRKPGILDEVNPFTEDAIEEDEDGRLVIDEKKMELQEKKARDRPSNDNDEWGSDEDLEDDDMSNKKARRDTLSGKRTRQRDDDGPRKKRKENEAKGTSAAPGQEYRSKKAAGDMRKTGKLEPFAYVPLDRQVLNPRVGKKAAKGIRNVVKAAQKGASGKRGNKGGK